MSSLALAERSVGGDGTGNGTKEGESEWARGEKSRVPREGGTHTRPVHIKGTPICDVVWRGAAMWLPCDVC